MNSELHRFFLKETQKHHIRNGSKKDGDEGLVFPFDLTGLDFCMTALFLIIFIDQWEKAEKHTLSLSPL